MALQPGDPGTRVSVGRAAGAADGARARLEAGRAEILERHRAGAGGQEVVRSISALTDDVVQAMFAGISGELQGAAPPRVALIATGGYGRRELSPRSDVDLLALLPGEDASAAERKQADAAAERLHRALWDAGLEAGFAARTLGQTLKLAREDHTARTALLDCRLVCGEPSLFKDLERTMVTELEARKVEEFIQEKLEELQVRRKRYGGSVWLLEPHLKQGKGGLRDLQAALWIARVRHKVAGLGEAGERGLLPAREVKEARAARDLLWRLRNELHYATGRRDDRLTFDNQRRAAAALGYQDSPTELGVEQLMRQTYIALQEIARASDALIDRCAVEDAPRPAGIFGRRRPPPPKPIDNAFQLWQGRVTVHDREVFARRPADLVRIFAVAETYGAQVYSYARDLLVQELQRLGPGLAADRDAHFEFWQILMREGSEGQALAPIHELGLLGALFPEVGRLRARAQHSLYHVYTVDTHTVFALQRLMRLRAGGLADVEPELTRIARAQQRPLALMLGLLFHDLGKGLGPDHSARGAELVRAYAQRISLDPGDAADVEWLVLAHLKMSHLSQRRDLEDMALIESFARELRTVERLEMLYLLTYADMASVSAENWTEWKARLLRLLYEKTRGTLLAEELDQPAHAESLELRRERLARAIEPLLDDAAARKAVGEFTRALPERYAAIVRPADAARHLKLWLLARRSGSAAELRQPESGEAELTLVAPDRPGLLALFSAALAANGIDILAAEVNSLEDGIALDRFIVREPGGGALAEGRWEAAHADLLRLLSGAEDPHRLVQRRLRRASWAASAAPAVETKVRVDNVSSADCTILDVFTQDRPGLLHAIADALHRAGASIEVARIATEGNRATDAFYLREAAGQAGARKIASDDRLRQLQDAVAAAIAELAGRS
ncbi:MAG TPA: [protein-PII] uridylyltransferase [Myxococcales bacterium]|nr:[protein-PII] uridylyltransferase [Myxococcales bacterium]